MLRQEDVANAHTTHTKLNSKWIKDQNLKVQNTKENMGKIIAFLKYTQCFFENWNYETLKQLIYWTS